MTEKGPKSQRKGYFGKGHFVKGQFGKEYRKGKNRQRSLSFSPLITKQKGHFAKEHFDHGDFGKGHFCKKQNHQLHSAF